MVTTPKISVVLDTSVLVNFLAIDRVDLLWNLPTHEFFITGHVRKEVTHPDQVTRLEAALTAGHLAELAAGSHAELSSFAALTMTLGVGESAAIAAAKHRSLNVGVDDRTARRRAESEVGVSRVCGTANLMIQMIQAKLLTVAQADVIKADWATNHRFIISAFNSFGDVAPP